MKSKILLQSLLFISLVGCSETMMAAEAATHVDVQQEAYVEFSVAGTARMVRVATLNQFEYFVARQRFAESGGLIEQLKCDLSLSEFDFLMNVVEFFVEYSDGERRVLHSLGLIDECKKFSSEQLIKILKQADFWCLSEDLLNELKKHITQKVFGDSEFLTRYRSGDIAAIDVISLAARGSFLSLCENNKDCVVYCRSKYGTQAVSHIQKSSNHFTLLCQDPFSERVRSGQFSGRVQVTETHGTILIGEDEMDSYTSHVRNTQTGELLATFEGKDVFQAWSPDGKYQVFCDENNRIHTIDMETLHVYRNICVGLFHGNINHSNFKVVLFTKDSAFCVIVGYASVKVFSTQDKAWLQGDNAGLVYEMPLSTKLRYKNSISVSVNDDVSFLVIKDNNKCVVVDLKLQRTVFEIKENVKHVAVSTKTLAVAVALQNSSLVTIYGTDKAKSTCVIPKRCIGNCIVSDIKFNDSDELVIVYSRYSGRSHGWIENIEKRYQLPFRLVSLEEAELLSPEQKCHMIFLGVKSSHSTVPHALFGWYDSLPESIKREYSLALMDRLERKAHASVCAAVDQVCSVVERSRLALAGRISSLRDRFTQSITHQFMSSEMLEALAGARLAQQRDSTTKNSAQRDLSSIDRCPSGEHLVNAACSCYAQE